MDGVQKMAASPILRKVSFQEETMHHQVLNGRFREGRDTDQICEKCLQKTEIMIISLALIYKRLSYYLQVNAIIFKI